VTGVRELYPGDFALVMATGICSTALRGVEQPAAASAVLLVTAVVSFAVLLAALGLRVARYPRLVARDLAAPDRAFAFFTGSPPPTCWPPG
jgi:tellurite resistance protein TehA-like permease